MPVINVARVLVLSGQGQALLLRRSGTDTHRPGGFDFPGGGIESGEDMVGAAARELLEETGIEVSKEKLSLLYVGTMFDEKLNSSVNRAFFVCEVDAPEIKLSDEHDNYQWVAINEVNQIHQHPFYSKALDYAFEHSLLN